MSPAPGRACCAAQLLATASAPDSAFCSRSADTEGCPRTCAESTCVGVTPNAGSRRAFAIVAERQLGDTPARRVAISYLAQRVWGGRFRVGQAGAGPGHVSAARASTRSHMSSGVICAPAAHARVNASALIRSANWWQ